MAQITILRIEPLAGLNVLKNPSADTYPYIYRQMDPGKSFLIELTNNERL